LVGHGEDILETRKAFTKIIAAALLRFDALTADFLTAAGDNPIKPIS
jgi:hypothetical protein